MILRRTTSLASVRRQALTSTLSLGCANRAKTISSVITKLVLDILPPTWYNTRMKDIEIMGDAQEEISLTEVFEDMAELYELFDMATQKENA